MSSGDLIADRRFEFARDLQLKRRSGRRRRPAGAGGGTGAGLCLGLVRARRNSRAARRPRAARSRRFEQRAGSRSGGSPRRRPAADAARRRAELAAMPPAYVRTLFDQYAPRFDARWSTISAIAARRCCSRPCWRCAPPPASRRSSSARIDLGCGTGLAARRLPGRSIGSSASICRRA